MPAFPSQEKYDTTNAYAAMLHESRAHYQASFHWTERHLQCVWFDERLRPKRLITSTGETVVVESPGRWNLEAGPDFLDAVLRVGSEARRITGDVEVHVRPNDWDHHHHDCDGLYRNVVLHVTHFASPAMRAITPTALLHVPLYDLLAATPAFSFDDVDLSAYPHAILPATPRPCELALRQSADQWKPLLTAAGRHRLHLKTERMRERLARLQDRDQLLYEEILASLGYKHNTAAFRRLAQHLPLASWEADAPAEQIYARLLGAAGLLPDVETAEEEDSLVFSRNLWDLWWRDPAPLPADARVTILRHATRPHNAPARRLAAAASLFQGGARLYGPLAAVSRDPATRWFDRVTKLLTARLEWKYWQEHLTITGRRQNKPVVLVGENRLAAMIANVVLPLFAADGVDVNPLIAQLPPEDISAPMRETAHALFGRDHNPALYASNGLLQQGLLQIHHDFCLNARAGCQNCTLAQELSRRYSAASSMVE